MQRNRFIMFTCLINAPRSGQSPHAGVEKAQEWIIVRNSRMKRRGIPRGKSSHPARKRIWNSDPASFWGVCLPLLITFIKIPWYEISRKLTPIAYHQVEQGESELVLSNNSIASCKERCIRTRHESKYWTPRMSTIGMDLQRSSDQTWFRANP